MALRAGALASSAEFLMCIDADALLDRNALFWMIRHFLQGPRVGAVTGNPRVVNRTSLLAPQDLGRLLGNRTLGAAILSGKRGLSKLHVKTLAARFKVAPEAFL